MRSSCHKYHNFAAHHGDNNNWGEYNTVEDVIAAAQNRAKVASKTMPDCLGGGIGANSPVWMRDYSQPNDKEPKNPAKTKGMIGTFLHSVFVIFDLSSSLGCSWLTHHPCVHNHDEMTIPIELVTTKTINNVYSNS